MKTRCHSRSFSRGYSLIEVVVAMSLLLAGVSAICILSMTGNRLDTVNQRKARGIATMEASARLWQLGLDKSTIEQVLPDLAPPPTSSGEPAPVVLAFSSATNTVPSTAGSYVASVERLAMDAKIYVSERNSQDPLFGTSKLTYDVPTVSVLRKPIP